MSDYISREALTKGFKIWQNTLIEIYGKNDEYVKCLDSVLLGIDSIHAADVRPVVLGRWTGNARHQSCSECHMTYCVPDGQDGELDMTAYHYCPNCGAMMEES